MKLDPLELAGLQVQACFSHDERGRLTAINDIGGGRAPLALITRTRAGALVRLGAHAPAALAADVDEFARDVPPLSLEVPGSPRTAEALRDLVARHAPVERTWSGPAFTIPAPLFPAVGAIQLYPANAVLLHPELATWGPELRERKPAFAVLRGSQAIAICASSRTTRHAAEAGVETVEAFRGQGAAGLAVAAWAAAIHESGRIPFYSTSWENQASQAVAAKLDLDPFGENIHVT